MNITEILMTILAYAFIWIAVDVKRDENSKIKSFSCNLF